MAEIAPPSFVDNGEGFPTPDSVRDTLGTITLGEFNLGRLADTAVSYRGQEGSMVDLIARCRIERLVQNWPRDFIAQVMGAYAEAGQRTSEG